MRDRRIVGRIILPCVRAARFTTVACRNRRNVSHGKQVAIFPHDDSFRIRCRLGDVFRHIRTVRRIRHGERFAKFTYALGQAVAVADHADTLPHRVFNSSTVPYQRLRNIRLRYSIRHMQRHRLLADRHVFDRAVVEVLRLPNGTVDVIRSGKAAGATGMGSLLQSKPSERV